MPRACCSTSLVPLDGLCWCSQDVAKPHQPATSVLSPYLALHERKYLIAPVPYASQVPRVQQFYVYFFLLNVQQYDIGDRGGRAGRAFILLGGRCAWGILAELRGIYVTLPVCCFRCSTGCGPWFSRGFGRLFAARGASKTVQWSGARSRSVARSARCSRGAFGRAVRRKGGSYGMVTSELPRKAGCEHVLL